MSPRPWEPWPWGEAGKGPMDRGRGVSGGDAQYPYELRRGAERLGGRLEVWALTAGQHGSLLMCRRCEERKATTHVN